jgi:hypothetical protein
MKAISVKEPWAEMIASGKKVIETRTWATKYRGPLLIVASLKPKTENSGKAIAMTHLINCRPMNESDERWACCKVYPRAQARLLGETRRIPPFHVKGQLGVYDVECEDKI